MVAQLLFCDRYRHDGPNSYDLFMNFLWLHNIVGNMGECCIELNTFQKSVKCSHGHFVFPYEMKGGHSAHQLCSCSRANLQPILSQMDISPPFFCSCTSIGVHLQWSIIWPADTYVECECKPEPLMKTLAVTDWMCKLHTGSARSQDRTRVAVFETAALPAASLCHPFAPIIGSIHPVGTIFIKNSKVLSNQMKALMQLTLNNQ